MKKTFAIVIPLLMCLAHTTGLCFVSHSPQILETRNWQLETDVGMSDWEKDKLFLDFFKGSVFEDEVRQVMLANGSQFVFAQKTAEEMFWLVASMSVGGGVMQYAEKAATARAVNSSVKYIGKLDDLQGIPRANTLLDNLPNLGSAKANYYQNSSVLRNAIRDGYEIHDASAALPNWALDPTPANPARTVGQSFLGAERNILNNKGYILNQNGVYTK